MAESLGTVSIITVTQNNCEGLRATLQSIARLADARIEVIVVDGHSTDATDQVVEEYRSRITHFEQDHGEGIYAAMNQGAELATGEWLIFMNAGDCFANAEVLKHFWPADGVGVAFGRSVEPGGTPKSRYKTGNPIWLEMPFNHQAMFCRRSLFEQHPYDARLKIAGDFEFVLWAHRQGVKFQRLDLDVAIVEPGGVSDQHYFLRAADWYRVARRHHFWNLKMHFHYYKKLRWARWMDANHT